MSGMDPVTQPIFVVGTGRSGTTLLRLMLCAHPRIHLTHEASFYVWETIGGKKMDGEALLAFVMRSLHFRWMRLDPREVVQELPRPVPRSEIHRFYTAAMRAQAAKYGKVRWGDKTPSHANHLKRVFEDYPEARVVRIVRDPRSVVRSLVRMPWFPGSLGAAAALIGDEQRKVAPFRDRILEISLEDLLRDPRATMERVLEHVGEPWDDAVLEHANHLPDPDDTPDTPWFRNAGKPLTPFREPDWTAQDAVELRLIERLTRKSMVADGYAPAVLPAEPGRFAVFWRWLRDLPVALRALGVILELTKLARDPANEDTPHARAVFRKLNPPSWAHYPGFEMPHTPELPEGWEAALND